MKKREIALALSILSAVSAGCIKGMKLVGRKIEERKKKEDQNHYVKAGQ